MLCGGSEVRTLAQRTGRDEDVIVKEEHAVVLVEKPASCGPGRLECLAVAGVA